MYTAQQIFDLCMDLVNKRQANGVINANNTAIYKVRAPGILTLWQNENAKSGDFYNKIVIACKPIPNLFGDMSGFDIQEHGKSYPAEDLIFEALGQCTAYSFETDGQGTVYIEDYTDKWNVLATINVPDAVAVFTNYKGIVTPTSGATKSRIRFSGDYYYRTVNRALFSYPMPLDKIPSYAPWIKYEMPDDFKSIDEIVEEYPERQYTRNANYKWEGRRDLYVNYYYEGKVRVVYKPVPIQITDLSQTLQIDEITSMSGAYFLAAHLQLVEDPDSANYFLQRYQELKIENNVKKPASVEQIIDIYS